MSSDAYLTRVNFPCSHSFRETLYTSRKTSSHQELNCSVQRVADNGSCREALLRRKPAAAGELESVFSPSLQLNVFNIKAQKCSNFWHKISSACLIPSCQSFGGTSTYIFTVYFCNVLDYSYKNTLCYFSRGKELNYLVGDFALQHNS